MRPNRLFLPQSSLDTWLDQGRASLEGETLSIPKENRKFHLKTALLFSTEVAGGGDKLGWIGRVKDLDQVHEAGGEYASGSVIVGDDAYEVVEGFAGELVGEPAIVGDTLDSAARAATDAPTAETPAPPETTEELELLARFFLKQR